MISQLQVTLGMIFIYSDDYIFEIKKFILILIIVKCKFSPEKRKTSNSAKFRRTKHERTSNSESATQK